MISNIQNIEYITKRNAIRSSAFMEEDFFATGTAIPQQPSSTTTSSCNRQAPTASSSKLRCEVVRSVSENTMITTTNTLQESAASTVNRSLQQFCQQIKHLADRIKSNLADLETRPRYNQRNSSTSVLSMPDEVMVFKKAIASLNPEKQLELFRKLIDAECDTNSSSQQEDNDSSIKQFIAEWLAVNTNLQQHPHLNDFLQNRDIVFFKTFVYEAQKALKKLATSRQGVFESEAQFLLANCYGIGGLGVPVSAERAFALYLLASKQNHQEATYRAGVCYELGIGTKKSYRHAIKFYHKAATRSHVSSMFKLAIVFLKGFCDQPINSKEALLWLQRAATSAKHLLQQPEALHVLALMQLSTKEYSKVNSIADVPYALELLNLAAKAGYVPSQLKLGELYEMGGSFVEVDDARSIYWYAQAAEHGSADGALALSSWFLTGSEKVLQQSDRNAYLWARKAAAYRESDRWTMAKANYTVGILMREGFGVRGEIANDFTVWFKRAAALGHLNAIDLVNETETC